MRSGLEPADEILGFEAWSLVETTDGQALLSLWREGTLYKQEVHCPDADGPLKSVKSA